MFAKVVESPEVEYLGGTGFIMLPYTTDFNSAAHSFRSSVKARLREGAEHVLLSHETLDPSAVGETRNVEGRELYNYAIHCSNASRGFSGDTHKPVTDYDYKGVHMTQVSTNDVLCHKVRG